MATTAVDPVFVDTNVLVYSVAPTAPMHASALRTLAALRNAGGELWISRQILREYMAAQTRPQAHGPALPAATIAADVAAFQTAYQIAEDRASITARLLALLAAVPFGGKQVHDANIVATMLEYGIPKLLTHNTADFARFSAFITVQSLVP